MSLSFSLLFVAPLTAALAVMFGVMVAYAAARERGERALRRRERLYACGSCGHVYVDRRDVPLAACPRCRTMNEAVKR